MSDSRPKMAVALRYRSELDPAPVVVAKGETFNAERIEAAAREAGVTVVANPLLAESLVQLPLGAAIPPELYRVVAEVLAFVYQTDKRYAGHNGTGRK